MATAVSATTVRNPTGEPGARRRVLPGDRLEQRMPEPEEAEGEEDCRCGGLPGPARGEASGDDEDLAREER